MDFDRTYSCNLSTFKYPPKESCTLMALKQICRERLQVYNILIEAESSNFKLCSNSWRNFIRSELTKNNLELYLSLTCKRHNTEQNIRSRKYNHIAHWILSLCYCKSTELKNFFINKELEWISFIYESAPAGEVKEFLNNQIFEYSMVPEEEKLSLGESLGWCMNTNFSSMNYKTKFENIYKLVKTRGVFIHNGYAYFSDNDMIHLIKSRLHKQFNDQLKWNLQMLPYIVKEDRIKQFLDSIPLVFPQPIKFSNIIVTLDDLDEASKLHFPLCMQHIHYILQENHHLKHDCRIQYGVFLKNLKLSYKDAMRFFEHEFTKSMSKEWYKKKYEYYFKHYYGKIGGMIDYKPYSCTFIQSMTPRPDQHHGCPFKHWDIDVLINKFKMDGLHLRDIGDIEDLVSENKYNQACTKYYCITRNIERDTLIQGPNQYCAESIMEMNLGDLLESIYE